MLDNRGRVGPFTHSELVETLATYADTEDLLVKRDGQKSWQRAGKFLEAAKNMRRSLFGFKVSAREDVVPERIVSTPLAAPAPTGLRAAHRWRKGGAIVGFVGDRVAFLISCIADWMSGPERAAASSVNMVPSKPIGGWNFVAAHWRGQLPLWVSFWIINFVVSIAVATPAVVIAATFEPESGYDPFLSFGLVTTIWLCILVILIWQIVGLWRSADNHIARSPSIRKTAPWAGLAKLGAIFMTIKLCATFLQSGVPQLAETARIAFMDDPEISAYSFRIMRNGTEVELTGGFKYGLTDKFSKLLKASRQIHVVHLNSLGGRIGEAQKLYKVIHDNGLVTYVASRCAAACTLAFAGGRERYVARRATLGFHAPSFPGMTEDDLKEAIADQSKLFIDAGFSASFVSRALGTPASDLWEPTIATLSSAKAITGVSDGTQFATSGFGEVTKEGMGNMLANNMPALQMLRERFPSEYQSVVDAFYASYIAGDTEADSILIARKNLLPILNSAKIRTDDNVLRDMARWYADAYQALGNKSALACYSYASSEDEGNSDGLPPELLKRDADLTARAIETASKRAPADPGMTTAAFNKLRALAKTYNLSDADLNLIATATELSPSKHREYCVASIAFFSAIAALPEQDAAIVMRKILEKE